MIAVALAFDFIPPQVLFDGIPAAKVEKQR
jgi:hypothetical protein